MTRWFLLLVVLLVPICASAIVGDLNNDGRVDFSDFFILADNFGIRSDAAPPDSSTANVTIYYDFSDPTYLWDWSSSSGGGWGNADGWLLLGSMKEGSSTAFSPPVFFIDDIDVSVDTRWVRNVSGAYGIQFRIGSDGTAYLFDITPLGFYRVEKWDIDGIGEEMVYAKGATIQSWGQNTLRVRTEGARLHFFINGTKVFEAQDDNFLVHGSAVGKVGLFVGGTLEIGFDNLVIRTSPNQIQRGLVVHDTITVAQTTPEYAIESRIDGDFNGWDGETIFRLVNGQIWQQSRYAYTYHYAYRPEVVIYRTSDGFKMQVDGVDGYVYVERTK